jgi:hypothetical protein
MAMMTVPMTRWIHSPFKMPRDEPTTRGRVVNSQAIVAAAVWPSRHRALVGEEIDGLPHRWRQLAPQQVLSQDRQPRLRVSRRAHNYATR